KNSTVFKRLEVCLPDSISCLARLIKLVLSYTGIPWATPWPGKRKSAISTTPTPTHLKPYKPKDNRLKFFCLNSFFTILILPCFTFIYVQSPTAYKFQYGLLHIMGLFKKTHDGITLFSISEVSSIHLGRYLQTKNVALFTNLD